ncbi:NYN domain-containing protein [Jiangella anatolica]|uniref:NYN domain-containing protein n=1 Tax=Jiangella anatolica TaxID=2670374 RepID=A0A2W2BPC6_9ACTN|nr:NYN domain-containing protein [Jiangella anatolica]PZF82078.1 NYN domain-containing protein [Jiangella anatolica]
MDRLIVYVDGFNMYHGLHDAAGCRLLWLDLVALARSLRPRSHLEAVKYFTAPVLDEPAAASRQSEYQSALLAQNPRVISIIQGRHQRKTITCKGCGAKRIKYEEKETDVNIAATLVADTARGLITSALIVSADSDLVPGINVARGLAATNFFAAAFPPRRYSTELKRLMPSSFQINMAKIRAAQLPDVVADPASGHQFTRPPKWKR